MRVAKEGSGLDPSPLQLEPSGKIGVKKGSQ